ncbi:hypothetical protein K6025_04935 [Ehrlichia sp. JZT12]
MEEENEVTKGVLDVSTADATISFSFPIVISVLIFRLLIALVFKVQSIVQLAIYNRKFAGNLEKEINKLMKKNQEHNVNVVRFVYCISILRRNLLKLQKAYPNVLIKTSLVNNGNPIAVKDVVDDMNNKLNSLKEIVDIFSDIIENNSSIVEISDIDFNRSKRTICELLEKARGLYDGMFSMSYRHFKKGTEYLNARTCHLLRTCEVSISAIVKERITKSLQQTFPVNCSISEVKTMGR